MKVNHLIAWLKERGMRLLQLEKDNAKLALGCSLGIYIALSPFVGFHTMMAFLFAWLFGLNVALLLTVSVLINNPWSMVPVYGIGYWVGDWICSLIGFDHYAFNPAWMEICNSWVRHYIGTEGFSFWAFMIGGNLLGILLAIVSYPLIYWLIRLIGNGNKERVLRTVRRSKQAVRSLKAKAAPMIQKVAQKRLQRTAYENSGSK